MEDTPYITIPAPGRLESTIFTNDVWRRRGNPPKIILSEGWTEIGTMAFDDATELQTIRIPASVVSIQYRAFGDAINLRKVEFVEGSHLHSIDAIAFFGTRALERINIPASVIDIGDGAFYSSGLQEVKFENGSRLEMIGFQVFAMNVALKRINIPASVKVIGQSAFFDTFNLTEVGFEQNSEITNIDPYAFSDSGLTMVAIGETALNRLNNNPSPLHFGPNNNFYGKENVTIVSRSQQINSLMFSMRNTPTRPPIADDLTRRAATFLMEKGAVPKSPAALAARVNAANAKAGATAANDKAGGRKSRRRKRGIRRSSRKVSSARRTQKHKSKHRRTMTHK